MEATMIRSHYPWWQFKDVRIRRPLVHRTLCDFNCKIDFIIECIQKLWCFHSVIHYRFQCSAWCTKRRVWMSPESSIPGLLFTTGFNVVPGALSDGSGCSVNSIFLWDTINTINNIINWIYISINFNYLTESHS